MKQTLQKKGRAWGSRVIVAALATVLTGLQANPPATAQITQSPDGTCLAP
jgi:hypothetical protein